MILGNSPLHTLKLRKYSYGGTLGDAYSVQKRMYYTWLVASASMLAMAEPNVIKQDYTTLINK